MPELTTGALPQFYHLPICDAAKELGVCETLLKKFCRTNGISRWPHRKIKSIENIVKQLQNQISQSKDKAEISRFNKDIGDYENKKEKLIADPNLDFSLLVPKSVLQSFSKVKLKNEKRKIYFDFENNHISKKSKKFDEIEKIEEENKEKSTKENCTFTENQSIIADKNDTAIAPQIFEQKKKPLKKKPLTPTSTSSSHNYTISSTKFSSPLSSNNNNNNIDNGKKEPLRPKISFDLSPLPSFSLNDNNINNDINNINNKINNVNNENCEIENKKNNNNDIITDNINDIKINKEGKEKELEKEEKYSNNSFAKYTFLEIPMTQELKRNCNFSRAKENPLLSKRNYDEYDEGQRELDFQKFKSSIPALKYQRIFSDSIPLYFIH